MNKDHDVPEDLEQDEITERLITERLKQMIATELGHRIPASEIDLDAPLLEEGLKLDSIAIVELIALSEQRFGVEFGENDLTMDSFASTRTLARAIESLRVARETRG